MLIELTMGLTIPANLKNEGVQLFPNGGHMLSFALSLMLPVCNMF